MDSEKEKSKICEDLVTLYLRLNGYFTTAFMLHSTEYGQLHTEVDCIGVRFPHSREPERGIGPDAFLEPSDALIDLALCEVKAAGGPLQFNKAIRKEPERFERILRWTGIFTELQVQQLAPKVLEVLTPKSVATSEIPEIVVDQRVRIRGLIFSPERDVAKRNRTEPYFVGGDKIIQYAWNCLCPRSPRATCATVYDYTSWGHLEYVVRYFKQRAESSPGSIEELYQYLRPPSS